MAFTFHPMYLDSLFTQNNMVITIYSVLDTPHICISRLMLGPSPRSAVSSPASSSSMPHSSCKRCFLVGVLLTSLVVICYLPLLHHGSMKRETYSADQEQIL